MHVSVLRAWPRRRWAGRERSRGLLYGVNLNEFSLACRGMKACSLVGSSKSFAPRPPKFHLLSCADQAPKLRKTFTQFSILMQVVTDIE